MASPNTTSTLRAVPHTEDRYKKVAQALEQAGYPAAVDDRGHWVIATSHAGLKAWLKVYDTPSMYGIHDGCVSKMSICLGDERLYHYDRGLDVDELDQHPDAREFFDDLIAIAN